MALQSMSVTNSHHPMVSDVCKVVQYYISILICFLLTRNITLLGFHRIAQYWTLASRHHLLAWRLNIDDIDICGWVNVILQVLRQIGVRWLIKLQTRPNELTRLRNLLLLRRCWLLFTISVTVVQVLDLSGNRRLRGVKDWRVICLTFRVPIFFLPIIVLLHVAVLSWELSSIIVEGRPTFPNNALNSVFLLLDHAFALVLFHIDDWLVREIVGQGVVVVRLALTWERGWHVRLGFRQLVQVTLRLGFTSAFFDVWVTVIRR